MKNFYCKCRLHLWLACLTAGIGLSACSDGDEGGLLLSNCVISLCKNFIPAMVRIPCYIVLIASIVTVIDMMMAARLPALHARLGIYIPLIVVNCIILGRTRYPNRE